MCPARSVPGHGRNSGGSPEKTQIERPRLPSLGSAPVLARGARSRRSGVALLHDIKSGATFPSTGAGARALCCTLAHLTYRQLCRLVQRPSETGTAIAARKRALSEWDKANPGAVYDPELFRREILPKLAGVKLSEIVKATGLSKSYASQVRAGKFTPRRIDMACLAELVGVTQPARYAR